MVHFQVHPSGASMAVVAKLIAIIMNRNEASLLTTTQSPKLRASYRTSYIYLNHILYISYLAFVLFVRHLPFGGIR